MKVSLVVASGTHQGKVVPISTPEFLIGREPQCNLRPASQAISKKHCGIIVRDGKVSIIDYGSTNGTLVNDVLIRDEEVPVEDGTLVMVGPLDFRIRIEQTAAVLTPNDGTPFPGASAEALAAVKAVSASSASATPARDSTPNPAARPATKSGTGSSKELPALSATAKDTGSKEGAALKAAKPKTDPPAPKPAPKPAVSSSKITATSTSDEDSDSIAAMLLGMDDGEDVPGGSTVMEMPAAFAQETQTGATTTKPGDDKSKKATSREDMTNAANDILRKMRRRPT